MNETPIVLLWWSAFHKLQVDSFESVDDAVNYAAGMLDNERCCYVSIEAADRDIRGNELDDLVFSRLNEMDESAPKPRQIAAEVLITEPNGNDSAVYESFSYVGGATVCRDMLVNNWGVSPDRVTVRELP